MNMIINIGAFALLTILWLGFAVALIFNQVLLDNIWTAFRALPWAMQGVIWLRLVLVVGLGWVTIYTFFPRKAG